QCGEDRDGQVEVAVLLHVEVDELGSTGRTLPRRVLEQGEERLADVVDGAVEGPWVVRRNGRGHLDGDVVDIGSFEQAAYAGQASVGLTAAEHRLAEEIDVEVDAAGPEPGDRATQLRLGRIHEQMADHLAQDPSYDSHDEAGRGDRDDRAELQGGAQMPGEERGCRAGRRTQVAGGHAYVLRTDDAVDERDREIESRGVGEHVGEPPPGRVDRLRGGGGQPAAHLRLDLGDLDTGPETLTSNQCHVPTLAQVSRQLKFGTRHP